MAGEEPRNLARYRIQQAQESLEEARYLFDGEKSPRSIVNRAYYAMFYSVLALLVYEPYSTSKHSGVVGYFNRRFIKDGQFGIEHGRAFNRAFEMRQRSDYREFTRLSREQSPALLSIKPQPLWGRCGSIFQIPEDCEAHAPLPLVFLERLTYMEIAFAMQSAPASDE
jgi:hypothetical protein